MKPSPSRILFIVFLATTLLPSLAFSKNDHKKYGLPSKVHVIEKTTYISSFNYDYRVPNWVAYRLTKSDYAGNLPRTGSFNVDDAVPPQFSPVKADYTGTSKLNIAQGHYCPAEDRSATAEAMETTFYYTNCAPQIHNGFNNGIWKSLEMKVRDWATSKGDLWIYAGVYFDPDIINNQANPNPTPLLNNHVGIPPHWYKIIYCPTDNSAVAFEFENRKYPSGTDLDTCCLRSIDQIEQETGLNFLSKLSKKKQALLESTPKVGTWN
jgi:endonuclease G